MAVVETSATSLAVPRVVFDVNPQCTVLTSLMESFGPLVGRLPPPLLTEIRRRARDVNIESLLDPLTSRVSSDSQAPGFLGLPKPAATFLEQVEMLRATPEQQIVDDLTREALHLQLAATTHTDTTIDWDAVMRAEGRRWQRWLEHPMQALAHYCDRLVTYFRTVILSIYPAFERRLHREVHRLELAVDRWGLDLVLEHLHPRFEFAAGYVTPHFRPAGTGSHRSWQPSRLVVQPLLAAPATVMHNLRYDAEDYEEDANLGVATGDLALRAPTHAGPDPDPLGLLVGVPRARVLQALRSLPGSTTDLAHELAYSPGNVSHHLKALAQAGAVESHRTGQTVCYHLTGRGHKLVRL
jgi:DNA-binding transcriptional ArsR family regulator